MKIYQSLKTKKTEEIQKSTYEVSSLSGKPNIFQKTRMYLVKVTFSIENISYLVEIVVNSKINGRISFASVQVCV